MIRKRCILYFFCYWILSLNALFGQAGKYSEYEKKPVNYSEKITYRYILKHNRFNSTHEIDSSQVDTVHNTDGSIKSITKRYQEIISTADYRYPDSTLYEKQIYNEKGLLIYDEERYHIHVDQPCFTQSYYVYDAHSREIQKDVFECDSFFHRRITTEFDDKLHIVKESLFDKKNDYLEYWSEKKFDVYGRKEKIRLMQKEGEKTEEWGRTDFSYEKGSRKIIGKIYEGDKLDKKHYWLSDKKDRPILELDCWPPNETHDTLVNHKVQFLYDGNGNLVQKKESYWEQKIEINYTYNRKNQLITEKYSSESQRYGEKEIKKYFFRLEYHYRNDGLLDYMDVFEQDGEEIRYRYEYKFKP